ncbi:MAG: PEP-CTERM system TPR-repeat protein PrsT [Alphaproteobacteria bacterium]|nr:PEP-CTERM system TPR-repeat protein PrsT [Alphaproteobacteria bacterium]
MNEAQTGSKRRWIIIILALVVVLGGGFAAVKLLRTPNYLAEGQQQLAKGDHRAALISLRNAVREEPNNATARLALAEVNLRLGDVATADKEIRRAVELGNRDTRTIDLLGRLLAITDKMDDMDKVVGQLDAPEAKATAIAWRGLAHMRHRRLDEAQKAFEDALAISPDLARAHLGLAQINLGLGRRDVSLAEVEKVLAKNPKNAEALGLRGELRRLAGDRDGARQDFADAISADPINIGALVAHAALLIEDGKLDDARKDVVAALRLSPAHPLANHLYALGAFKKGDFKEGADRLEKLGDLLSDYPPNIYLLALAKYRLNELSQAESLIEKFLTAAPEHVRARIMLADLVSRRQNYQRAVDLLRPLVDRDNPVPEAATALASAYLALGNQAEAKNAFDKAAAATDDSATRLRIGLGRLQIGESAKALSDIEAAIDQDNKSIPARTAFALALLRGGQVAKALEAAEAVKALEPDKASSYLLLGTVHVVSGDWEKARAMFREATRVAPAQFSGALTGAVLDLQEGYGDRAADAYRQLLQANPNLGQAALALGNIEAIRGNDDQALEYYERARQQDATAEAATARSIALHVKRGNKDRALQIARDFANRRPNTPASIQLLAQAQYLAEDAPASTATLRQLIGVNQKAPEAYMTVGRALQQRGDKVGALAMYKDALNARADYMPALLARMTLDIDEGRSADARNAAQQWIRATRSARTMEELVAMATLQGGRPGDSISLYKDLLRSGKAPPTAQRDLVNAYISAGDMKSAGEMLEQMQAKLPTDMSIKVALAEVTMRQGDEAKAVTIYESVLAAAPRNAIVLNNLAWLYSKRKDKRALSFAEAANRAAPGSRDIQDTLGQLLIDNEDYQRGVWLLRMARANGLDTADSAFSLARGLVQTKRADEARAVLKPVLEKGSPADKAKAEALLKQI